MKKILFCFIAAIAFHQAAAQTSNSESPQEKQDLTPALVSPAEGAELDNNCKDYSDMIFWSFHWTSVPGATQYHLYVRGARARFPVIDKSNIKPNGYFQRSRAVIVPGNYNGWHWKVRAKVNGKWGPWSENRSFDVESWNIDCGKKRERISSIALSGYDILTRVPLPPKSSDAR